MTMLLPHELEFYCEEYKLKALLEELSKIECYLCVGGGDPQQGINHQFR